jgi:ribosomal protein S27E
MFRCFDVSKFGTVRPRGELMVGRLSRRQPQCLTSDKTFLQHTRLVSDSGPFTLRFSLITFLRLQKMPVDLFHPNSADEKSKHKLKRLIQSPNSFFMDVKCPGCFHITTVFSHAQVSCFILSRTNNEVFFSSAHVADCGHLPWLCTSSQHPYWWQMPFD